MSHSLLAVLRAPLRGWVLSGLWLLTLVGATAVLAEPDALRVGSKRFTESYILAEVLAQTVQVGTVERRVEIKQGLGNTAIVYAALQAGSIDLYPEYLGTVSREILKNSGPTDLATLRAQLKPLGLGLDIALGFNNGYALAVRADVAQRLGLTKLSDLARQPGLRLGLSNEFIGRADGWPGLAQRYGLKQKPQGLDHGLAFDAIAAGQVDVIDIYTTDAKIAQQGLRLLQDDGAYFARYDAMLLYRLDLPQRHPEAWAKLQSLRGRIDEAAMIRMNAQAELRGMDFAAIAKEFLAAGPAPSTLPASTVSISSYLAKLTGPDLARLTWQHLSLVVGSVGLAALLGIPLATWLAPYARLRGLVLGATGLMQTVPALALLAVLISAFNQIGTLPALLALTLYALLPIMRNTCTGLAEVPAGLRLAGMAMGFTTRQRLRLIDLPLAAPLILAGLRTATSIAVGTATIAAFIGAGGYGERIVTGLALNDRGLLLAGALPAALLALAFEGLFALLARQLRRPDQADFLAAPR